MIDLTIFRKNTEMINKYRDHSLVENADLLELLDMLEAAQKDAARYQWLRKWKGQEHEPPFTVQHEVDGTVWGGDLDYAIDAAMQS